MAVAVGGKFRRTGGSCTRAGLRPANAAVDRQSRRINGSTPGGSRRQRAGLRLTTASTGRRNRRTGRSTPEGSRMRAGLRLALVTVRERGTRGGRRPGGRGLVRLLGPGGTRNPPVGRSRGYRGAHRPAQLIVAVAVAGVGAGGGWLWAGQFEVTVTVTVGG
ncbi:hypothetical protein [Streptomyces sp. CAI-85]|uniref:hypothetical protein n=1 Tax=Streptomyces sp. CAI-85 TaxID=1472662 RepID=UPI0020CA4537|nr:hypothetical protein [Streptomyces sp. CAI-85]